MLDAARGVADLNRIADGVLVFEDDVKTGDHVADEILRAETHGDARESGERERRGGIDAEQVERRNQRDRPNHFAYSAVEYAGKCARLLFADLCRPRLAARGLDNQLGDDFQKPVDQQREKNDAEKMERRGKCDTRQEV